MVIVTEAVCDKSEEEIDLFTLGNSSLKIVAKQCWHVVAVCSAFKLIKYHTYEMAKRV